MNRRNFIRNTALGVGATMLPISMFGNDTEPTQTVAGSITLIHDEYKFFVAVPFDETGRIKLHEMYQYIKELWKDDPFYIKYPFPMLAITPNAFEVINGWHLVNPDMLYDGSVYVVKTNEHYTGIQILGTDFNGFDTKIEVDGRVYDESSIIANIRGKKIYLTNGDATKHYEADALVGRVNINDDLYGKWIFPPVYFEHYDLT